MCLLDDFSGFQFFFFLNYARPVGLYGARGLLFFFFVRVWFLLCLEKDMDREGVKNVLNLEKKGENANIVNQKKNI